MSENIAPTLRSSSSANVAIVGGGPAGLAAAEYLSNQGVTVDLYDAMPSLGRKFLMAGRGGLNLTHSEAFTDFCLRFGSQTPTFTPWLQQCPPEALRAWTHSLGIDTFIGSSGRVFPREMKAAPLLRAWLHRLRAQGVRIHVRHRWLGWYDKGGLRFATPEGEIHIAADATLLALGGGSWAKLGSDGNWLPVLAAQGIDTLPLRPANCGFELNWSDFFRNRFAGEPLKNIAAACVDIHGIEHRLEGECMLTAHGIEGGLIYALSAHLREVLARDGSATLNLDLLPHKTAEQVFTEVAHPRGSRSLSSHLQSRLGIHGAKAALLREALSKDEMQDHTQLARTLKALPLRLNATRPIDEAISTAGGVAFSALDEHLMLRKRPGVFCAGEMLDWEAPTGGYLLTGCFATGQAAARGIRAWLQREPSTPMR